METKLITAEDYTVIMCILDRLERKLEKITPLDQMTTDQLERVTYNNQEVGTMLDCSQKTLQNYRDRGLISFSQVGPKIWFTAQDVQMFLTRNKIQAKGLLRNNHPNA